MSSSRLELIRSAVELVENLEKALAQALAYTEKYPKETVVCDILIQKFMNLIQKKSNEILFIYNDSEGLFREENEIFSGQKFGSQQLFNQATQALAGAHHHQPGSNGAQHPKPDVWSNFYDRLSETQTFHQRYGQATLIADHDNQDAEVMFNKIMEEVIEYCDKHFTTEEGNGKYVDLHTLFNEFVNIKKLRKSNIIKCEDYLTWLQNFDKLYLVPFYMKTSRKYQEYLNNLKNYLVEFFKKTQPLIDWQKIEEQNDETHQQEWEQGSLFGWEDIIGRIRGQSAEEKAQNPLHCAACNKTFTSDNVFQCHKKGKKHIKAVNKLSTAGGEKFKETVAAEAKVNSEFSEAEVAKLKAISHLETKIMKLKEILADVFANTENLVRKKQSKNYFELEADFEMNGDSKNPLLMGGIKLDDEDDDRPKYNPKNLPMGWDGRPIPYWLYKLHGLGIEFKCEICGGASYWGRRAYEKHFQEWRHAYGMKCLKIPNTVHFKDVTEIEHALRLHKKILQENFDQTFKPDFQEEFEDGEGNIYSRKQYIDLKRQGLI